ncbi:hypothetical protein JTE90_021154 [Oedothorax gibbosus]|uniref:Uncharacterized protein n=1 Tax=Oedothorax gibbosus TaxID=931172 RepID=A0AAV6U2R3_9ARAC|nr:hypothetical protein JTE90_021154 [Oedothorax gibbosus]
MANSPAPTKWPTDLKQTEAFKKFNSSSSKHTECVSLENLINKITASKNPANPTIAKYIIETCNTLRDFMITYKQYQLSYTTQNVLVGEFFAPAILKLYQEIANLSNTLNSSRRQSDVSLLDSSVDGREQLQQELREAKEKILSLESKISSLVDAQQVYLRNAMVFKEAKEVLEDSYATRCEALEHVSETAAQNYEQRYQEKLRLLDQIKEERVEQVKQEELVRTRTLQEMKATVEKMCSNVFQEENAHIDRILKGVHQESEKREQILKEVIKEFSSFDGKLSSAVADLHSEISAIKTSAQVLSPAPATTSPPPQAVSSRLLIQPRPFVILVYPEPPSNSPSIEEFQTLLWTTSKTLHSSFKCTGIYLINNGFKISLPSIEDRASVSALLNDPALNTKFKLIIPKISNALFCIKFTTLTCSKEVAEELSLKNPEFVTGSFKVIFPMKAKGETHWVIEVDPKFYD